MDDINSFGSSRDNAQSAQMEMKNLGATSESCLSLYERPSEF